MSTRRRERMLTINREKKYGRILRDVDRTEELQRLKALKAAQSRDNE